MMNNLAFYSSNKTVNASALYIVIIISLVIGVLCSLLIVAAFFYKNEYLKNLRYVRLENNLNSGINLMLTSEDTLFLNNPAARLFGNDSDSVSLSSTCWGIYDVGIVKAFVLKDTVRKAFTFAQRIDSVKWAALYLSDRDRALSVSGKTSIVGNAFIPKAGVKKAYAAGEAYQGDENLIEGHQYLSQKLLPKLLQNRLMKLEQYLQNQHNTPVNDSIITKKDTLINSFFNPTLSVNFGKKAGTIKIALSGNIVLYSDTTLIIDSSAKLDNVLVFAKSVIVKCKFHGKCQLFAKDSIRVESDCVLNYPSCLGTISTDSSNNTALMKISIGENSQLTGTIFTYRQSDDQVMPLIALDKNVIITGQVYSQGMISYKGNLNIQGSVATKLFIYQSNSNLIENLLIDSKINSNKLSPYFLSGDLFNESKSRKYILQWLE